MKNIIYSLLFVFITTGCFSPGGGGELTGAFSKNRDWVEMNPYGMKFVEKGSFIQGNNDQDVAWSMNSVARRVSVASFWMDDTEITNNEYRQFIHYVRDSIVRQALGEDIDKYKIATDKNGNDIDPPLINWVEKIDMKDEAVREIVQSFYYPENESFYGQRTYDVRKFKYSYQWVDHSQAKLKPNRYDFKKKKYTGVAVDYKGNKKPITGRDAFIIKEELNIYPDTLCWSADFSYAYNEPLVNTYFWHPGYSEYPIVGVTWYQAKAFCHWRTEFLRNHLMKEGRLAGHKYELPTEAEWEYAARGGLSGGLYPWGNYYTRNDKGCFLANFKPLRGNYVDDGGFTTMKVGSYPANDYGLYDMAGNVAEWTKAYYDETSNTFGSDLNPTIEYNALPDDPIVLTRKVVRGGSWKDIAYFLQCGTRTYEYADTAKSYIGFRCVRRHLGQ